MALPLEASQAGVQPYWIGDVAVDDVDDAAVQIRHLGGRVLRAPADAPGVGRFAFAADPQGAVFQLLCAAEPRDLPASGAPGLLGWRELHAADWPEAPAFYGAMFGWEQSPGFDMGPLGRYQQFRIGGTPSGGMFNRPAVRGAAFWLCYFNVDDIDSAAARVTAAGGRILHGPQQLPGGGWVVRATDPQGAMFALLGLRR